MIQDLDPVVRACAFGLDQYVALRNELALRDGYELGRSALAGGCGILDMVQVCSRVLASSLAKTPLKDRSRRELLAASEAFFVEVLSPFEMAHRGFREANTVLRRMNHALEDQSRRIAAALHDEAAQLLTPLHLGLSDIASHVSPEVAHDIKVLRDLLRTIEERLRHLSHQLRPPILEHVGLVPALDLLIEGFSRRWNLPVHLRASLLTPLPPTVETALYHSAQEALTNVARHANATEVVVSIERRPGAVVCAVRDDGTGIRQQTVDMHASGVGLAGIQERVKALGGAVRLGPGDHQQGTTLTIEIPLEN